MGEKVLTRNLTTGKITQVELTKFSVDLGNVDNTADQDKPHPYFQIDQDLTETTTTSTTTYTTKTSITTPSLPLGTYRVEVQYQFRIGANRAATLRVREGASNILTQDETMSANASNFPSNSIFAYLQNVSGVKELVFEFKVGNTLNSSGSTLRVSQVTMAFWRVL